MKFMLLSLVLIAAGPAPLSAADRSFVEQAMTDNSSQIRQGQVFADSGDALVRSYAAQMTTDHSEANTQLIALAHSRGMRVDSGQLPDLPYPAATHDASLSAQQKADAMAGLTPAAFFRQQVRVHQQAIALYKHEVATGDDRQVVTYAKQTLQVLESHLSLAQRDLRQEKAGDHG